MNSKSVYRQLAYLMMVVLVLVATWAVSAGCNRQKQEASATAQSGHEHAKKETWTCPMHPQVRQDAPGKCSICGMDLVKADVSPGQNAPAAQGDVPDGHAVFHLPPERQQMIGVKFGKAEKKPLFKTIEASGRVAFDPELYTAQTEYVEALKQLQRVQGSPIADVKHSAQRMVESAKLRLKILGLSDKQIAELKEESVEGSALLLTRPGENVWIYAEIHEMDLPSVRAGLSAKITGGVLGGEELAGRVVSVDRVLNPATRTAKVRIQVVNARSALRPETFVNVSILAPLGVQVAVPFDAVLDTGKQAWVFVEDGTGHFEPRLVTIRFQAGDEVAIESGLKGGEKIVTSGNFLLDSESRLKGVAFAAASEGTGKKTPECPPGQEWHAQMNHCMAKVEN